MHSDVTEFRNETLIPVPRGEKGETGEDRGDRGERGERGKKGLKGLVRKVASWFWMAAIWRLWQLRQ